MAIDWRKYWKKPKKGEPNTLFERLTTAAGFSVVVTLLVVLAGAGASLFTEGIRNNALNLIPAADSGSGAVIFWLMLFITLILVFANQRGVLKKTSREQEHMSSSLAKLDSAVKRLNTLPSEQFLPSFHDSFREALAMTLLVLDDDDACVEDIEKAIRGVLGAIAESARDFDGVGSAVNYGANVMLFRSRDEPSTLSSRWSLVDVGPSHAEYLGVLELYKVLSTCTASPGEPDARTPEISLPVPSEVEEYYDEANARMSSVLLPGAPAAFMKRSFESYSSRGAFLKSLLATGVDRAQVRRLRDYFESGAGKSIESFASIAIVGPKLAKDEEPEPVGVLNIHSERAGLMEDNGAVLFGPLVGPFIALLAILIDQRRGTIAAQPVTNAAQP